MIRGADPRCFTMVMATGIVSVALRMAGSPGLSAVLLWVDAAAFVVLVVASAGRIAAFGPDVRRELRRPDRLFSYFAFPAAASVLAARLAEHPAGSLQGVVAVLVAVAALAWIAVTCAVAAFLARWARRGRTGPRRGRTGPRRGRTGPRRAAADVNGTWQLWVVGTQSVAIAAASAASAGVLAARLATWAAVVTWSAGAALYPAVTALVVARLRVAGLAPGDPVAPYWVTMGAASITVLSAAQVLELIRVAGPTAPTGLRSPLTGLALAFWSVATGLIPALLVLGAIRWRPRDPSAPRGFRREMWMIVFPAGMYATASMRIGAAAGLPLIRGTGTAAAWIAAGIWAAMFAWMAAATAGRLRRR